MALFFILYKPLIKWISKVLLEESRNVKILRWKVFIWNGQFSTKLETIKYKYFHVGLSNIKLPNIPIFPTSLFSQLDFPTKSKPKKVIRLSSIYFVLRKCSLIRTANFAEAKNSGSLKCLGISFSSYIRVINKDFSWSNSFKNVKTVF